MPLSDKQAAHWPVVIVGAGAAGLYAACHLDSPALLIERGPEAGRKLLLTGGGRCNLTHESDVPGLLSHYRDNSRFLLSALSRHDAHQVRTWFHQAGVPTLVDDEGRVYPRSFQAKDVRDTLLREAKRRGMSIAYETELLDLRPADRGWLLHLNTGSVRADRVLLTTGGASYPRTGSDGSVLELLRRLGISVTDFSPALTRLLWSGDAADFRSLTGLSLADVRLALPGKGGPDRRGSLLFTHGGLSGPAALNLSRDLPAAGTSLLLDLQPDLREDELAGQLIAGASASPGRRMAGLLAEFMPRNLAGVAAARYWPDLAGRLDTISHRQYRQIAATLLKLPLPEVRPGPLGGGMVSRGGIDTDQLDPRTMMIRGHDGLYAAGELIGLDGETGGYNLQLAFATARAAAEALSS